MPNHDFAKQLRRNMTDAEQRLWYFLRGQRLQGFKLRRQQPIGTYIVDFVCHDAALIVEVDGGQHAGSVHDQTRDAWLRRQGYRVMRYWNDDVMKVTDVDLQAILDELTPSSTEREKI